MYGLKLSSHNPASQIRHLRSPKHHDAGQILSLDPELGKLAVTLRGTSDRDGIIGTSTPVTGKANGIRAIWAGDVSPALGGTVPEHLVIKDTPPVIVIHGGKGAELANQLPHPEATRAARSGGAGSQEDAGAGANDGRQSDER